MAASEAISTDDLVAQVASAALRHGRSVAVAESLTGGMVAQALAAGEDAGRWFRGAVVAYHADVKHHVLAVPPGPVVSDHAAEAMAANVARLLGASVAVATTGVGGPDTQDSRPVGTVWIGVHERALDSATSGRTGSHHRFLRGDPETICCAARDESLRLLVDLLQRPGP